MSDRGSAWDGQHNRRSTQEPGQRYLRVASTVCFCDSIKHLAGNLASSQREPGNKGDFIALAIVHHVVPFAVGKAITVLHGNDGNNLACALDMFLRDVGQRDQANLAFVSQPSQSFDGRFKGNDGIRSVQLINVDAVQAQSFETSLNRFAKVRGSRIMGPLIRTGPVPASFGRYHKTSRIRKQRFGNQFFVYVRPVGIRGIDEIDIKFHRPAKNGQSALAIFGRPPDSFAGKAHGSEAETIDRNFPTEGNFSSHTCRNLFLVYVLVHDQPPFSLMSEVRRVSSRATAGWNRCHRTGDSFYKARTGRFPRLSQFLREEMQVPKSRAA